MTRMRAGWLWLALWLAPLAQAAVSARDAAGGTLTLAKPAQRVVALVPHAVEMLYAVGAGSQLVATVNYADYPPEAKRLPRVGGYTGVSLEAVMRQQPDLVIVWADGTAPRDVARLRSLGIPVFVSRPLQLDDVARELESLGALTGHGAEADRAAARYRAQLAALKARYAVRPTVSVFLQVGELPLYTVSDKSFVGQLVRLCGGNNVFGAQPQPAPQVSVESVIRARPQVLLSTGALSTLAQWRQWGAIPAVQRNALYALPADLVVRPGPRLVDGAEAVCRTLDDARARLGLTPG
ncbi:cobalamin-binding protein [Crenobacter sp. SG2303]|uniref:Cobalamin-binding protein n=1 Tax=Crenobacter oryzisoli TaxID=3056844 RepID=A0ABT7XUV9_9NEIS|nr:cobalamin-binding protein [Crenobacter sp. SG2303]MDN0077515.1 cobalamin-binding protein [Crenobacter sp. SG2303]